jgi:hypothetical protein
MTMINPGETVRLIEGGIIEINAGESEFAAKSW